ncbi:ParA family protein [Halogranum rubrum]|uniref:AAA domain-containing protein n=1 Tax=Halogranum salarium B-1 TaxID=1210908 RepID=J3JHM1_9EURY|nr:ParA family protein [Halogranum salarium]EJN61119.1 hypothetical protein HSB1_01600 [Halogranum salarium B-1]
MPNAVTFWTEAGGTGKTTFTVNTAAALSRRGYDVLAIDFDPQNAGMTDHMGYGEWASRDDYENIADLLVDDRQRLDEIVIETPEFDLIPTHNDLANIESKVEAADGLDSGSKHWLLHHEMEQLTDLYDYVLVDPPATTGTLVSNAMIATQNVVAPAEMTDKGIAAIGGLEEELAAMERGFNRIPGVDVSFSILGVVPNRVQKRETNKQQEVFAELEASDRLITPFVVYKRSKISDAWGEGMSVFRYHDEYELRDYQLDILDSFESVADLVEGTATETDDLEAEVAN